MPSKPCTPIYTAQEAHCNTIDHIIRILPFLHGIRRLGYEILTLAAPPLPLHPPPPLRRRLRHRISTRRPFRATSMRPPPTSAAAPLPLSASAWLRRKLWGRQDTAPSGPSGQCTADRHRRWAAAPLHRRLPPLRHRPPPFLPQRRLCFSKTRLRGRILACQAEESRSGFRSPLFLLSRVDPRGRDKERGIRYGT